MTDSFSDEIWMQILNWVPPLDVIRSISPVSKQLLSLVKSEAYWKSQTGYLVERWAASQRDDEEEARVFARLNLHQLQRACIYGVAQERPPLCLQFGSLFVSQQQALFYRNNYSSRRRVCIASSSHHTFEMLENVMAPGKTRWWCSRPNASPDSSETLLFATKCPLAILTKLFIRPMVYPFSGDRVFTWREMEVKAYQLPLNKLAVYPTHPRAGFPCVLSAPGQLPADITRNFAINAFFQDPVVVDSRREQESLTMLLKNEVPVYESGNIPVQNRSYSVGEGPISALPEIVELPNAVANVISVTLIGKDLMEPGTDNYYAGVEHLDLVGVPLLKFPEEKDFISWT